MKKDQAPSVLFYSIWGLLTGVILFWLSSYKVHSLLTYSFVVTYSMMFLLARSYTCRIIRLAITTVLPAFLCVVPFVWHDKVMSAFFLPMAAISGYALNAFNIVFQKDGLRMTYRSLFEAVWDTFVRINIAQLFTWIIVLLLVLWASLFKLIGINFFFYLFMRPWFILSAGGLFVALGIYLAVKAENVVSSLRGLCLAFCYYLLPLLSAMGLIFMFGMIINVGVMGHSIKMDSGIFMWIALLEILFVNGVYQDGSRQPSYRRWLLWLVNVFIVVAPVFPLLAIFSLFKAPAYAYSFSFFVFMSIVLFYTVAYAVSVLASRKSWLRPMGFCNIYLALLFIAVTIFFNLVSVRPVWFESLQTGDKKAAGQTMSQENTLSFLSTIRETHYHWLPKGSPLRGVILGFSGRDPIYLCKSKLQGHAYLGVAEKNSCHMILKDKIKVSADYMVLTGPDADVVWETWDMRLPTLVPVGFMLPKSNEYMRACRTIYKNRLYLGFRAPGSACMIEVSGKPVSSPLLQYLHIKKK